MLAKNEILTLPEYQALPRKLRQYVINRTIWQMTHAESCRLCRITNRQRVADDSRVQAAIDAVLSEKRPPKLIQLAADLAKAPAVSQTIQLPATFSHSLPALEQAAFFEGVRRLARDRGMWREAQDPQFASTTLIRTNGDALLPDSEVTRG